MWYSHATNNPLRKFLIEFVTLYGRERIVGLIRKIVGKLRNYFRLIFLGDKFVLDIKRWFSDNGDKTLRLDYDLSRDSVVFDVGGYEGAWAQDISARFSCKVFVFEPVPAFAVAIQDKFADNTNISVCSFGLSNKNGELAISLSGDGSSFYATGSSAVAKTRVRKFDWNLLEELGVGRIDLMKINIEGSEYDLLDLMIENETISVVSNLQIQFHNFVPNAIARRDNIRRKLSLTHAETWCYEFVWENWILKDAQTLVHVDG